MDRQVQFAETLATASTSQATGRLPLCGETERQTLAVLESGIPERLRYQVRRASSAGLVRGAGELRFNSVSHSACE